MPNIGCNKIVTIVHNVVNAKLVTDSREARLFVSEALSYEIAGAEHMTGTSFGGRSSFYKFRKDIFPTGFVRLVKKKLEREGYKVIVKTREAPPPLGPVRPKVDDFPDNPDYEYQMQTADRLVSLKNMIAQIATGGGKSRVFKICAERIGRPTLFVTTRKTLMYQMADIYKKDIGKRVGIVGDSIFDPYPEGVNFATVDTLASHLRVSSLTEEYEKLKEAFIIKREVFIDKALEKKGLPLDLSLIANPPASLVKAHQKIRDWAIAKAPVPEKSLKSKAQKRHQIKLARRRTMLGFLAGIEFVCLEEAHEVSSNSYYLVMSACKNAHYRLALTGTPFMKNDEEANMRLMACTGTIGIIVSEKQLIDCGILATPYFKIANYPRPPKIYKTTPWQKAYGFGIVDAEARNGLILEECQRAAAHGLPTLILVQQTKHGTKLCKQVKALGLRCVFISGSSTQEKRQRELDKIKNGQLDVIIGSTILDVGVDVPAVGLVILAGGGKAEVAFRQRVGRGMRAKKSGPNIVFILDFNDIHNKHLKDHTVHRISFINNTAGFMDNIVSDFEYRKLGLKKRA